MALRGKKPWCNSQLAPLQPGCHGFEPLHMQGKGPRPRSGESLMPQDAPFYINLALAVDLPKLVLKARTPNQSIFGQQSARHKTAKNQMTNIEARID